jgi:hypothetical protein
MKKVYRITAIALVKPKGERKMRRVRIEIDIAEDVSKLSKQSLEDFVLASYAAKFRTFTGLSYELQEGLEIDNVTYWKGV